MRKKHPKYTFISISVNNFMKKVGKGKNQNDTPCIKKGRPNFVERVSYESERRCDWSTYGWRTDF